jgi:hypothetical protein
MPGRAARRWRTGLAITGTVLAVLAVVVVALWLTVLPRALANLSSETAAPGTVVTLRAGADTATIAVPDGWVVQHPPFQDDTVLLLTPDAVLETTVSLRPEAPDAALTALVDEPDLDAVVRETLADGLSIAHAESGTALVAAAGRDGGAPTIGVVARVSTGSLDAYRLAIAQLIDGMRITS